MDKQKTQRIIGILVIIAFVIVLIPLFFGKTNVSTEITSSKPLTLPEQNDTTTAKADSNEGQTPDDSAILGSAASSSASTAPTASNDAATNASTNTLADNTDASTNTLAAPGTEPSTDTSTNSTKEVSANALTNSSSDVSKNSSMDSFGNPGAENTVPSAEITSENSTATTPVEHTVNNQNDNVADNSTSSSDTTKKIVTAENVTSNNSTIVSSTPPSHSISSTKKHKKILSDKRHSSKIKPVNLSRKELEKLQSPAWVLQMGNFKDKNNARRLADKLRQAGYKAFTKEIKSAKGNISTRVYIGPEFQHNSALQLASKVEQETKIHGIIISIKPLQI